MTRTEWLYASAIVAWALLLIGIGHKQIFVFDMLAERMRELFPDAHEVPRVGTIEASLGECMVTGTKR